MTTLKETLTTDLKTAMRARDNQRRDTLRGLLSAIKQVEIDQQTTLEDPDILVVLQKEAKSRQETIDDFFKAGRPESAHDVEAEMAIIQEYLPTMTSADQLGARAAAIIQQQGLSGPGAIGPVMKQMMEEFRGRADGREINQIVRKLLSK